MQATPDYRKDLLYLIAFNSSLGSLAWGYCIGIFNSIRTYLQTYLFPDANNNEIAFLASSLVIGASIGSYFCGKIVSRIGRRKTLLLCDIVSIVGSCFSMVHSLGSMTLGRFISGLVLGVNSTAIPLYNIEMAPVKMKGTMSSISMVVLTFGVMMGLSMSFFVPTGEGAENSGAWRWLMAVPILINAVRLSVLLLVFKFETPFYLTLEGNTTEARRVLEMIYTDNIDQHMQKVIKDKEATTSAAGNLTLRDLISPRYRKASMMGLVLATALQLTGFSPIFMFFNVFAAESADNDQNTLALFSTLLGFISFLSTLSCALVIEKFGRRPLMIYGTLFLFILEMLYFLVRLVDGPENAGLKYLMIIWPIFYRLSVGTLGFVYISELLPSAGVAFATFINWFCSFFLVQTLLPIADLIGANGWMFFYASFSLFSLIWYHKYLIESKGKTKAELLALYSEDVTPNKGNDDVEMKKIPLLQK